MKKILSLALAGITAASVLASCAPVADRLDSAITLASSDAAECAAWLDERLETFPTEVILGIGSSEAYGIDMSDFEEDGYVLRSFGKDTLVFGASADGLDRAVRAYAKAADVGAAETLDETYHEGARIKRLTVAGRDIAEFTVVYNHDRDVKNPGADSPTFGNAMYAAEELVRLIAQATGVTLTAVPHTETVEGPVIFIDYYTEGDLGENGFTYKVENGNLYINGVGKANGCANAVYYGLQHECGWDALLYGDSDLQEADHVDVPEGVSKKVKPMFDWWYMRHMYYDDFDTDKSSFSHKYRGSTPKATHHIGTWAGTPGQNICPTDEGRYLDVFDNVLAWAESNEDSGKIIGEDFLSVNLGMEDATDICMCKTCLKVFTEEGKALSGAQIRFANRLATDMEDAGYYGLKYSVYAYAGSNAPCITHTREDVYVTYCTNGHCQNHKLDGSECYGESTPGMGAVMSNIGGDGILNNEDFGRWLQGWNDVCDHVYVYTYMLPGNFAQYTNIRTLYDDIHFVYESGMEGYTPESPYLGLGLGRLRFQLIMDMIWHPEMTRDEYELRVGELMRREYGDGYDKIADYIYLWYLTERDTGCWDGWVYVSLITTDRYDTAMYATLAPRMYDLLCEAIKGCSTAKQEDRIKRLMCDVLYKECYTQYFEAYDAEDTEKLNYLEGRFDLFVDYLEGCGYNFDKDYYHPTWSFGPSVSTGGWPDDPLHHRSIESNLTDAAWINWIEWRDELTPEGTVQRPMPEKYQSAEG